MEKGCSGPGIALPMSVMATCDASMVEFSQDDLAIITQYPLSDSFNPVHHLLQEVEHSHLISYNGTADGADPTHQTAISRLLVTLMGEKVAFNLHPRTSSKNIASELSKLFTRVQDEDFHYDHYRPVIRLILKKASDVDIWKAVLNLITAVSRTTPPASVPLAFDGTPVRSTSSLQKGSEQTRRVVEGRIFEEIRDCTHKGVRGFFKKYFEGKYWSQRVEDGYRRVLDSEDGSRWPDFPNPPTQKDVLDWWFRFQDEFLLDGRSIYFSTASKRDLTGSDADRQVDLLLKLRGADDIRGKHNWKDIQVVGELKRPGAEIGTKGTLLQMARYVREVFIAQPTRRFVHAFAICGTKAEAWVFDRSGPFSSGSFDINEEPKQFFQMIVGYAMMTDEELGLDTFITNNTITTEGTVGGGGGGSAPGPEAALLTFSWTSDKRAAEKDLLKLARERGVKGVAAVIGYRDITNIAELRGGLTFEKRHTFRSTPSSAKSSFNLSHSHDLRPRPFTRSRSSTGQNQASRKRRSPDKGAPLSKRARSSSQQSGNDPQETELPFTVQSMHPPSLFDRNSKEQGPYDNRILRCLVISPAGRPIYEFCSPMELLVALRDAIRAHQSLYLVGNILHRDISENNIIITDPETADGNSGMLIDLDLAKEISSGRSGARHQTGTMEFMAIEVLRAVDHTYRHDLESFFYVFIWQCARNGWERFNRLKERPEDSLLNEWYTGSYMKIAGRKGGHMDANNFEYLLWEFPLELECVKTLCRTLRRILFPIHQDSLFTGTPVKPETLYEPIIQAFDTTIKDIEAVEG
ncbi:uncharacterized protein TRUGW13939_05282 [Talaromyces rugulosus]|uniref:non-specific serine/threonine protein kinase n=1 Tax=Talaromyces rugulosus TaxID=121627 RepID=A0A7H8QXI5_TALRU|nr:uncharacterized protein TRUGW13939_05282 [Talaromyces rugulosus]QKX58161.1 hypothetical protein TRUGW13939_05282 [Talaromyces rugulosus]